MPASFTSFLSNLLPDRGSPTAEASDPQLIDSKAFGPRTNDEPEDDRPQRKRRRVHRNPSPGPEVINLISEDEDEEADSPGRPAIRPQSQLQRPYDEDGIVNVHCAGTAIPLRLDDRTAVPDRSPSYDGGTNDADKSSNPTLDQQAWIPTAGPSIVTPDTFPVSTSQVSQHVDQSEEPSRVRVPIKEPLLCPEQAELVDIILSGRNVFYTGSAGCGKSTVLKAFTRRLRDKGLSVDIVAPTGISALGVGGSTTFVYAGWNLSSFKQPLDKVRRGAHGIHVRKRLKNTDVLVIDEISSK
ncbi:hypothetical protein F4782DRAFT_332066 [Xylaria castorea]|nr:hypothetical protein F4782DRAFT_332066 [Xylaria castorea]